MGDIVGIIIIIYVVIAIKKAKGMSKDARNGKQKTDETYHRSQRRAEVKANRSLNKQTKRHAAQDSYSKGSGYSKSTTKTTNNTYNKMSNDKAAYSSSSQPKKPEDLIVQGDILEKANAEVNKQHTDDHEKVLNKQMKHVGEAGFEFDNSPEGTAERMKKVKDLMITGYGGNIEFQRDFIAEGMDMINKITTL